jgi:hypothetical protein
MKILIIHFGKQIRRFRQGNCFGKERFQNFDTDKFRKEDKKVVQEGLSLNIDFRFGKGIRKNFFLGKEGFKVMVSLKDKKRLFQKGLLFLLAKIIQQKIILIEFFDK